MEQKQNEIYQEIKPKERISINTYKSLYLILLTLLICIAPVVLALIGFFSLKIHNLSLIISTFMFVFSLKLSTKEYYEIDNYEMKDLMNNNSIPLSEINKIEEWEDTLILKKNNGEKITLNPMEKEEMKKILEYKMKICRTKKNSLVEDN